MAVKVLNTAANELSCFLYVSSRATIELSIGIALLLLPLQGIGHFCQSLPLHFVGRPEHRITPKGALSLALCNCQDYARLFRVGISAFPGIQRGFSAKDFALGPQSLVTG